MNKIHPLYFIFILVTIIVFLQIKKLDITSNLQLQNRQLATIDAQLQDLSKIKGMWQNSSAKLENIIKNKIYKTVTFEKEDLRDKLILRVTNISHDKLRILVNKILNSYIIIQKISLQKEDSTLSMIIEIEK